MCNELEGQGPARGHPHGALLSRILRHPAEFPDDMCAKTATPPAQEGLLVFLFGGTEMPRLAPPHMPTVPGRTLPAGATLSGLDAPVGHDSKDEAARRAMLASLLSRRQALRCSLVWSIAASCWDRRPLSCARRPSIEEGAGQTDGATCHECTAANLRVFLAHPDDQGHEPLHPPRLSLLSEDFLMMPSCRFPNKPSSSIAIMSSAGLNSGCPTSSAGGLYASKLLMAGPTHQLIPQETTAGSAARGNRW